MAKKHDDDENDKSTKEEKKAAKDAPRPDQINNLSDDDGKSAKEPYPQGQPPDPEDEFEKIHGFRRAKE